MPASGGSLEVGHTKSSFYSLDGEVSPQIREQREAPCHVVSQLEQEGRCLGEHVQLRVECLADALDDGDGDHDGGEAGVEFDAVREESVEHLGQQVGDVERRQVELAVLDRLVHHGIHG